MEIPESGLLGQIRPPRLEDAGLEDCALPPDSIKEAFQRAADAVRSIVSHSPDDDDDGRCVNDPWTNTGVPSDALLGISKGVDDIPESCATKKGDSVPSVEGDDVVIAGVKSEDEKSEDVVVASIPEKEREKACVDGLQGLEISDEGKKLKDEDPDNDDDDDEKPRLIEGVV